MTTTKVNMLPARPPITDSIIEQVCQDIANQHGIGDVDSLVDNYTYPMCGEEVMLNLARNLGWQWGIEIDHSLIDDLHNIDFLVDKLHDIEVEKWIKDHNVKAPLPIGTHVEYPRGNGFEKGVIDNIFQSGLAKYLIIDDNREEGSTTRAIVPFESVEAIIS